MKIRRHVGTEEVTARCTACSEWKLANARNFYLSTRGNTIVREGGNAHFETVLERDLNTGRLVRFDGELHRVNQTDLFRSHCRACEAIRSRARRSGSTGRTSRNETGRYFGIELELTGPSASQVMAAVQTAGVSVRFVGQYRPTSGAGTTWELKSDGSVHGHGLELASPKLRANEAGFETLRKVLYALQGVGATVDASCGMHVHIDFSGMGVRQIKDQVLGALRNQENLLRMNAPSRRTNSYCPRWSDHQIRSFSDFMGSDFSGQMFGTRGVVNFGSYPRHGSIEFRSHGGTTNFAKASAWIKMLLQLLSVSGTTGGLQAYSSPAMLLNAIGVSGRDAELLLRFERAAEILEAAEYADETPERQVVVEQSPSYVWATSSSNA